MSFDDFTKWRDTKLAKEVKEKTGKQKAGYYLFNNIVAKLIFDAKPSTMKALESIKGIPKNGEHWDIVSRGIIKYFNGSSLFS